MTQSFRTASFVWEQPALYQVSIRIPGASFTELSTYTFPLSPNQLRADRAAMSRVMDVQGSPAEGGVKRLIDMYGVAPPVFLIEGTTGWDRHSTDGYILGGIQSMQLLKSFLDSYVMLNQRQRAAGATTFYTLEFYDYFSLQFWVIEPIGMQIVRQTSDRPMLTYYRFQWAAQRPVGIPIAGEVDALLQVFAPTPVAAALNAVSTLGAISTAYTVGGPNTAVNLVNQAAAALSS